MDNENAETVEAHETEGEVKTPTPESVDPLDAISDPDQLRKIAKDRGAAYKRVKGERDEAQEALKNPTAFLTKEDLYKTNEKTAKEKLKISESVEDKEISENFDAILEFYKSRSGRDTVEGILKDIRAAHAAWKYENPTTTDPKDAVRDLQGTPQKGKMSSTLPKTAPVDSRFDKPKGPDNWYPKKEQ